MEELASDSQRVGRYLSQQRELRGISLDELASLTRIPRRSLERLEGGAFDGKGDGFARGFVRTVAEALGLDPDEAVMRLMAEPRDDGEGAGGGAVDRKLLLAWIVGLALLLLAVVGIVRIGAALLAPSERAAPDPVVLRRDPVRALAEGEGQGSTEGDAASPPP